MKTAIKYPYGGGNGTAKRNKQNILRSPRETIKRAKRRTRPKEEEERGRMSEEEENTLKYLRLPLQPQSFFQLAMWVEELQKSTAWCAKHAVKQDPGRAMQNSLATAGTNLTNLEQTKALNSVFL